MSRKKKLDKSIHHDKYVIEGAGLRDLYAVLSWAEKKGYPSGHTFKYKSKPVRVWLAEHYFKYFKEAG